jgi:hypothetical protein
VTNRDYERATATQVTVSPTDAATDAAIEVFKPADKTWSPAKTVRPGVVPLELPAGGGVLLRW